MLLLLLILLYIFSLRFALLPCRSLYVFFMQAKAYSDIQDSSLSVTVSGDIGEAKVFQTNELDKSGMCADYATLTTFIILVWNYYFLYVENNLLITLS